jgi:hypothetical protein
MDRFPHSDHEPTFSVHPRRQFDRAAATANAHRRYRDGKRLELDGRSGNPSARHGRRQRSGATWPDCGSPREPSAGISVIRLVAIPRERTHAATDRVLDDARVNLALRGGAFGAGGCYGHNRREAPHHCRLRNLELLAVRSRFCDLALDSQALRPRMKWRGVLHLETGRPRSVRLMSVFHIER